MSKRHLRWFRRIHPLLHNKHNLHCEHIRSGLILKPNDIIHIRLYSFNLYCITSHRMIVTVIIAYIIISKFQPDHYDRKLHLSFYLKHYGCDNCLMWKHLTITVLSKYQVYTLPVRLKSGIYSRCLLLATYHNHILEPLKTYESNFHWLGNRS